MLRSTDPQRTRRTGTRPRVLVFAAGRDWHTTRLLRAFQRRGVAAALMALEECAFDTSAPFGMRFGDLSELPDGVLVKNISAGSFEAVTRRLGILHALGGLGVTVWNTASAVERCVDKSMTTFLLAQAGVPVPQGWTVEGIEAARRIVEAETAAGPLVLKPLFGSQGRGLALVRGVDDLPPAETLGDVYYLQRFVGQPGPKHIDFRIFVVNGEPIAAMGRRGANWITNVKQGARPIAMRRDAELDALAVAAVHAVGASYCGVDIMRGPDGAPYVLEVNSMPAWSGLQKVATVDVADTLVESFCNALAPLSEKKVA